MKPKIGLPHGTLTVKSESFPRVDVHRWSWLSERQVLLCFGIPLICIIQRAFGGQPNTLNKAAKIKELQVCFFFHRTRNLMVFGSLEWACKFQSAQRSSRIQLAYPTCTAKLSRPARHPPKNPRPKLTRSVLGAKLTKLPYDP